MCHSAKPPATLDTGNFTATGYCTIGLLTGSAVVASEFEYIRRHPKSEDNPSLPLIIMRGIIGGAIWPVMIFAFASAIDSDYYSRK